MRNRRMLVVDGIAMIPPQPTRDQLFTRMIQEGYTMGNACCVKCGKVWEAAVLPDTPLTKLECPVCLEKCSLFYEFDK